MDAFKQELTQDEMMQIKDEVKKKVHEIAKDADWTHLKIPQRQNLYEAWSEDPQIGGRLKEVMEAHSVRVYLKDTIMRSYSREQKLEIKKLLNLLSIPYDNTSKEFIKPQALLCNRKRLYTLTAAREWKIAILSAFERANEYSNVNENTVFITDYTTGRFIDKEYRSMINSAAERLDINVHWLT